MMRLLCANGALAAAIVSVAAAAQAQVSGPASESLHKDWQQRSGSLALRGSLTVTARPGPTPATAGYDLAASLGGAFSMHRKWGAEIAWLYRRPVTGGAPAIEVAAVMRREGAGDWQIRAQLSKGASAATPNWSAVLSAARRF